MTQNHMFYKMILLALLGVQGVTTFYTMIPDKNFFSLKLKRIFEK